MAKRKKQKQRVRFRRMNWDAEFYKDVQTGQGFIITEPAEITVDGVRQKSMYGAQSPLYGTAFDDEQSYTERFRCACKTGGLKGAVLAGEICPVCNKPVMSRDVDLKKCGWISLGEHKIINPYYFNLLMGAIGKTVFTDIVWGKHKVTKNGKKLVAFVEDFDIKPTSPFHGIGIPEFYKNYEKIIKHFMNVKKNKTRTLKKLLGEKNRVFTSHVPISTTVLRLQSITDDSFYYNSADKIINTLFSLSENIKDCMDIELEYLYARIQSKVNLLWDTYFTEINGKEGLIRGEILGGSLNFTSRNVIVLDPTLRDSEVDVSYYALLVLLKYQIIYYLVKLYDINVSKAKDIWNNAIYYDEMVYDVMKHIITNDNIYLLINRNPTLNYYSMLRLKVRDIHHSKSDYSLAVPLGILDGLNADFDGDILNIIALEGDAIARIFEKFNPIKRMIISRDTGLLNDYFATKKSQLIDVEYFSVMEKMENDAPETFPVRDNDTKEIIYVPREDIPKYKSGELDYLDIYDDAVIGEYDNTRWDKIQQKMAI